MSNASNVVSLFNPDEVLNETWNRLRAANLRVAELFEQGKHQPPTEEWLIANEHLRQAQAQWHIDLQRDRRFRGSRLALQA